MLYRSKSDLFFLDLIPASFGLNQIENLRLDLMAPPEAAFGLNRFWVVRKVDFKGLFCAEGAKKRYFKGDFENLKFTSF